MTPNYKRYCGHCERLVLICGACGNNTCNGGYGEVLGPIPGTLVPCDQCPSAYDEDFSLHTESKDE